MKQTPWRKNPRVTLRVRVALWITGLLLTFSAGLVLFINVMTTTTIVAHTVRPVGYSVPSGEGGPLETPRPLAAYVVIVTPPPSPDAGNQETWSIEGHLLRQVRLSSLLGLGLVALTGGAGAYWLTGRALSPVSQLSRAVRSIDATTLDRRLDHEGPDDELKELAKAFDLMLDRLQGAFEQQGCFVSDAAHELRTPLATLRANLEVVRSDPDATEQDYRETMDVLERTLARLEDLVSGLLLLAQGEHDVRRNDIVLGALLEDVLSGLSFLAREHGVSMQLRGELEVLVKGDPSLLSRAFANLIENGVRYNCPDGKVNVTVRRENEWAAIDISDTGMGIPAEEQERIFERFYRVDRSRSRHKGGAGLGLSIAHHVVQLHRGSVQVKSVPGEGSTFVVRLPLASPHWQRTAPDDSE